MHKKQAKNIVKTEKEILRIDRYTGIQYNKLNREETNTEFQKTTKTIM